jgi:hypothetical protein
MSTWPRILLVTFCLLAFATFAHAECAWVQWEQTYSLGLPSGERFWTVLEAFEKKGQCDVALKKLLISRLEDGKEEGATVRRLIPSPLLSVMSTAARRALQGLGGVAL